MARIKYLYFYADSFMFLSPAYLYLFITIEVSGYKDSWSARQPLVARGVQFFGKEDLIASIESAVLCRRLVIVASGPCAATLT